MEEEEVEDDIVCLDESFFINDESLSLSLSLWVRSVPAALSNPVVTCSYQLTTFSFGPQVLQLFCLQAASTDFDLTGQLVWPGAVLMNDYISKNAEMLRGSSIIELGSGVGVTGILCSRFCSEVVLTDHNEEVLKILQKNIELQSSSECSDFCAGLVAEPLEWGSSDQINKILSKYSSGFDLVLGADICFQQSSIPLLFGTVEKLLRAREPGQCKFILSYVSRAKTMDALVIKEASSHGMWVSEVPGTRTKVKGLEGVIFKITLQ